MKDTRIALADVDLFEKLTDDHRTALRKTEEANANIVRFYQTGKYAQAESLLKEARAGRRKALGEAYPDTLTSVNNDV